MKQLEIAVAGAGPAGLAMALALNRAGHHVTLFDQFAEPQPIGSGLLLQPTGLAVLEWLGLADRMQNLGARIDRLHGKANGRVVLDVRYAAFGPVSGLAVHRAGLFNVLHDAVKAAQITVKTKHEIISLRGNILITHEADRVGPFDLIVDALGSRSPLIAHAARGDRRIRMPYGAIWASLPWPGDSFDAHALEQRYHRASQMCGVLPIGKMHELDDQQAAFFWSMKTEDYASWQADGLVVWKQKVMELWPEIQNMLATINDPAQLTLAVYDHHTLPVPYGKNLVFIGDSAHSTSPQLGQGANMALLDVASLMMALDSHDSLEAACKSYARARRFHVRLFQVLSYIFTPFYQSDSRMLPLVRDSLVASANGIVPIQRLLVRIVSGQLGLPAKALALMAPSR